ncbi:MAG: glycoside hydrolase family 1 protein [Candidatus Omnitrophica bacterium]|nr:glycoside hydrolase family 1 protein [Candidatus Omnitrophota bacterium]
MNAFAFPKGFLWGAATSAHQVEGNNVHSDWWAWEQAGRVKEASGLACDHHRRFAEDFDLAVSLGHNAHRLSVEWARIEPEEGRWDEAALAHYVEVIRALRQRHLEPIVSLHHFSSPQWLTAQGGWTHPKVVEAFARYCHRVAEALGDQVRYWVTINEPMVFLRLHYLEGLGPPGMKDMGQGLKAIQHMIRAHAAAFRLLHERRADAQVSIAAHLPVFAACKPWRPMDLWVTRLTDRIFNVALLSALTEGRWSVPGVANWTFPEARRSLDYLGVNFYGRQFLHWVRTVHGWPAANCDLGHHPLRVRERTSFGWDVHPPSFYRTLTRWSRLRLPILITENGAWMTDDARRWAFIHGHLQAVARAIRSGARVIGYCYWSLLDNFEWADGYTPRFGIVEVDYATQRRTVRDSGKRYAEVCRSNRLHLEER